MFAPNLEKNWYYQTQGGVSVGPLDRKRIEELFAAGHLQDQTLLRHASNKAWISKAKFENPEFVESAPIAPPDETASAPAVISSKISVEPELPKNSLNLQFHFMADDGHIHGPVSAAHLERLHKNRLLSPSNKVRAIGSDVWTSWVEQRAKLINEEPATRTEDWFFSFNNEVFGPHDLASFERIWSTDLQGQELLIYHHERAPQWVAANYTDLFHNELSPPAFRPPPLPARRRPYRPGEEKGMLIFGICATCLILASLVALVASGAKLDIAKIRVVRTDIRPVKETGEIALGLRHVKNKDYAKAMRELEPLTKSNALANYHVGMMHLHGLGVKADRIVARPYLVRAAGWGLKQANASAGHTFSYRGNTKEEQNRATFYFKLAAQDFDREGIYQYGLVLFFGKGVDKDIKQGVDLIQRAATRGHPAALYDMGTIYLQGIGREKNERQAFNLFLSSAEKGLPEAMIRVGISYLNGIGTARDVRKALEWMNKAADKGAADALTILGIWNLDGSTGPRDLAAARTFFEKALQRNQSMAAFNLGHMYLSGTGVQLDRNRGMAYLRQAAALKSPEGMIALARQYHLGIATPPSPIMALACAIQARKAGFPKAAVAEMQFRALSSNATIIAADKIDRCF